MKRKRGHKKGKSRKLPLETAMGTSPNQEEEVSTNSEENSGSEEENDDKTENEAEAVAEVETQKPKVETPPERVEKVGNIRPDGVIERPPTTAVYGRVKVKLKTSKPIVVEPQAPSSEPPGAARSDVDKGTKHVSVDEQAGGDKQQREMGTEKVEESANSMPESKKSGGIKMVSTKGLSPPGGKEGSPGGTLAEEEKDKPDVNVAEQRLRYNKKELEASLEVIKKVMKMDAAEPFNVPVNPIELGIPDYFDIIDTPMDFGTVRSNLESGTKYMDSEDVYKDVQYIWNNCYKYNNKGDYIVDLMKRVKKNFMKYWVAAGLYTEQSRKTIGGEGIPMDEATTSSHGKKFKRGKGVKRHKDDCMCAICIMKRRRREREAREAQEAREAGAQATSSQTEFMKIGLPQEYKQEENSHVESPFAEDTSSYMETSPENDADVEMEDGEDTRLEAVAFQYDDEQKVQDKRMELRDKSDRSEDMSERSQRSDKVETESYSHVEAKVQDESAVGIKSYAQGQSSAERQLAGHLQQQYELLVLEKKRQKFRLLETFCDLENPMLSDLCGALFPSNPQSIWNGANSLVRHQKSHHKRSGIHEAIASLMTPSRKRAPSLK